MIALCGACQRDTSREERACVRRSTYGKESQEEGQEEGQQEEVSRASSGSHDRRGRPKIGLPPGTKRPRPRSRLLSRRCEGGPNHASHVVERDARTSHMGKTRGRSHPTPCLFWFWTGEEGTEGRRHVGTKGREERKSGRARERGSEEGRRRLKEKKASRDEGSRHRGERQLKARALRFGLR